jgi:periplasmic protein TonB
MALVSILAWTGSSLVPTAQWDRGRAAPQAVITLTAAAPAAAPLHVSPTLRADPPLASTSQEEPIAPPVMRVVDQAELLAMQGQAEESFAAVISDLFEVEAEPEPPAEPPAEPEPERAPEPENELELPEPIEASPREAAGPPPPAEASPSDDAPPGADVDVLPRPLPTNAPPAYPVQAYRQGIEGRVILRVRVAADGSVLEIALSRSSGAAILDAAALEAVRGWTFSPARRAGRAVPYEVAVPVRFVNQP